LKWYSCIYFKNLNTAEVIYRFFGNCFLEADPFPWKMAIYSKHGTVFLVLIFLLKKWPA